MATVGSQRVTFSGAAAVVRLGYQRAARLGAWTIEGGWISAAVLDVDGFRITQSPLDARDPVRGRGAHVSGARGRDRLRRPADRPRLSNPERAHMGSRYRKQEEVRLDLTGGDWLLVRKHLTAGEERDAHAKVIKAGTMRSGERPELDLEHLGIAQAVSYLLDWSITDADDKPIRIRDASYPFVFAALGTRRRSRCARSSTRSRRTTRR